jgi:hypothetical protein
MTLEFKTLVEEVYRQVESARELELEGESEDGVELLPPHNR